MSATFGQTCAMVLKEAKRANPTISWESVAEIIQQQFSLVPPESRQKTGKREIQTQLFNALVMAVGSTPEGMTKTAQRAAAIALNEIRAVCPELTPFEIQRRAQAYRQRHPDWPLTPNSLCKHWADFGGERTLLAKKDIYHEPAPIWREIAARIYPGADSWVNPHDFSSMKWLDVSATIRPEILKQCP